MKTCKKLGGATLPSFKTRKDFFIVQSHFKHFGDWWLGAVSKGDSGQFVWSRSVFRK